MENYGRIGISLSFFYNTGRIDVTATEYDNPEQVQRVLHVRQDVMEYFRYMDVNPVNTSWRFHQVNGATGITKLTPELYENICSTDYRDSDGIIEW
jgi:hypothetical protein